MRKYIKYIVLLLSPALVLTGCATLYSTPKQPVCDKPEAADSIICKISREQLNMEPEQLDGILLDTVAIGKVAGELKKAEILIFISHVETIVASSAGKMNYAEIIKYLELQGDESELIAVILSRHLRDFGVPTLVSEFDQNLMLKHLEHQKEQLQLFKE
jgi:hypothetical protein